MNGLEANRLGKEIELLDEHVIVDFGNEHRSIARRIGKYQSVHTEIARGMFLSNTGLGEQMSRVTIIKSNFNSTYHVPGKIIHVSNRMVKGLETLITVKN